MPSMTRRRALAILGVSASTAGLAGCATIGCRQGDIGPVAGSWPMDGGGPGHAGHAPDAADPRSSASVGWCFEPAPTDLYRSVGTPAVARGKPSALGTGDIESGGNGAVFVPDGDGQLLAAVECRGWLC